MKATDDPLQRDATFLTDMDERPEPHGSIQGYSVVNCR
jgi:ABC transporter substrate binding protein